MSRTSSSVGGSPYGNSISGFAVTRDHLTASRVTCAASVGNGRARCRLDEWVEHDALLIARAKEEDGSSRSGRARAQDQNEGPPGGVPDGVPGRAGRCLMA